MSAALAHLPPTLAEQAIAVTARTHVPTFIDFVLRNSKTGARIQSAPVHEEWHTLADRHPRLIIQSAIELGKTQQLVIGRALHFLGNNPNGSILLVCNTASQASQNLGLIAEYIETSRELALVFPGLRPDRKAVWNQSALTVERTAPSRDPSVMAIGIHGNVLGARIDLMIIDDPCDAENSCTVRGRDDISRWIDSTLLGRLTVNARVIVCGNPWHRDDLLARLSQRPGFVSKRYAVTNMFGRSRWPAQWPASRIAAKRIELQAREAARQLDCLAPDEVDAVFHSELIGRALAHGEGASTEFFASAAEIGATCVVGVDVAYSEKRTGGQLGFGVVPLDSVNWTARDRASRFRALGLRRTDPAHRRDVPSQPRHGSDRVEFRRRIYLPERRAHPYPCRALRHHGVEQARACRDVVV